MEATIQQEKSIIQIELFKYQFFSTKELMRIIGIGLLIVLAVNVTLYYFFNVRNILVYLDLLVVITTLLIIISPYNYLFPDVDIILIIAFGEFQLMKNKNIIWSKKIEELEFIKSDKTSSQIPIVTIKSKSFKTISIGYGRPKTSKSKEKIDYLIFSKLDWEILNHYRKLNS